MSNTGLTAEDLAHALIEMADEKGDNLFFTVKEVVDHLGLKQSPDTYRAFVRTAKKINDRPSEFLDFTDYSDIARVEIPEDHEEYEDPDNYDEPYYGNWAYKLVTAEEKKEEGFDF